MMMRILKLAMSLGLEYSNDHEQSDSIDDTVKSMILLLIILVNDDAQVVSNQSEELLRMMKLSHLADRVFSAGHVLNCL